MSDLYKIAVIGSDGIGSEINNSAITVAKALLEKHPEFDFNFEFVNYAVGGCAIDLLGAPMPPKSLKGCKEADAVLLGAIGGPKWKDVPFDKRPESALLKARKALGLFANIRPMKLFPDLKNASPLKEEYTRDGIDIIIVRELIGGIYFGRSASFGEGKSRSALDTEIYSVEEIERTARIAFSLAQGRRKKVTSVDKANVLKSSKLWREVVCEVAKDYPDVELDHLLVDNASMQLIKAPSSFDVLLTNNIFGDILSDEAAEVCGSIGMQASASLGNEKPFLFEPIHGSAPDIAGKGIANPCGAVRSIALMLKYSFGKNEAADIIENAVIKTIASGFRTRDIFEENCTVCSTAEMTERIIENL